MRLSLSRSFATPLAVLAAATLPAVQPAAAQSVLRDAETEALLNDMSAPLIKAAGLNPRDVRIVLINDDSINAFVAGGSEAGAGILAAGQQAAMSKYLAFSRQQETSTDSAGAKYLNAAGVTGRR